MGFADAVRSCLRNYVTFSGRATRPEYWYFFLFVFLGGMVANLLDYAIFGGQSVVTTTPDSTSVEASTNGPLAVLFSLLTFLPMLAAGWRRMHDSGRSGLYLLYPLIVMVGVGMFLGFLTGFGEIASGSLGALTTAVGGLVLLASIIVLLVSPLLVLWWLTRPSQPGANRYGPPAAV